MKTKFKSLIFLTGLISLGLFCSNSSTIHSPIQSTSKVQASQISYNTYLQNRVDRYARQRRNHYYPQINRNFRSLSNIRTANGKYRIKGDRLFRSGNLNGLSATGARELNHLHVKEDIDMRYMHGNGRSIQDYPGPGEFRFAPNNVGLRLHYKYSPVETGREEARLWPTRKRLGETFRFGWPYTTAKKACRSYHNDILNMTSEARHHHAVMWNCTQGRDRTGVLSAIVLSILGVSRHTITNDFLLTNHYKYQSPYTDQISRINKFYRTVYQKYGNMRNYVHNGLYLSNHELNSFRNEFLVRVHHRRK